MKVENVKYIYHFEQKGTACRPESVSANNVWMDVGNAVAPGVFDHHHARGEYGSALMVLIQNAQYMENVKNSAAEGKDIYVHIHEEPDMDCISCVYALKYYIEHDKEEFDKLFGPDGKAQAFVSYVNDLDEGRGKNTSLPTLYAILCAVGNGMTEEEGLSHLVLQKGLKLVEKAIELLQDETRNGFDLYNTDFSEYAGAEYAQECALISEDTYEREKIEKRVVFETIQVWDENGEAKGVDAAIWTRLSKDPNGYNHARKEGAVFTMVPGAIKGDNAECTDVIISLERGAAEANHYSLEPLAEVIEQMEQMEDLRFSEETGHLRRDYSRPRTCEGIMGEKPFSVTSDPWYISDVGDMLAAPRAKSMLDYEVLLELVRNNAGTVKRKYTIGIKDDKVSEIQCNLPKDRCALSKWSTEMARLINNPKESEADLYKVIIAEVDASLIQRSNRILEAYCMNLVGRSYQETITSKFLWLDYRTCIYTDLNCTIVLLASYKGCKYEKLDIAQILNLNSLEAVMNSKLVGDVRTILRQRNRLIKFGKDIGDCVRKRRKEIERLNESLINFSAKVQKENMKANSVEREVYSFIQSCFEVDMLKTTAMESMNMVVNQSREKMVSKFNLLSAISVPMVVVASIIQAGFMEVEEIVSFQGKTAMWIWIGAGILSVIFTFIIWILGNRRQKDEE